MHCYERHGRLGHIGSELILAGRCQADHSGHRRKISAADSLYATKLARAVLSTWRAHLSGLAVGFAVFLQCRG